MLAQAVTILKCIREEPRSILSRDTDYSLRGFHGFPQPFQANAGKVRQIPPWSIPATSSPIHYSLMVLRSDAIWSGLVTASLINHKQINKRQALLPTLIPVSP
jgi:hypothetical protein